MRDYKLHQFGPGGMHCACCNDIYKGRSMKFTKQVINRKHRHADKVQLKKNLE